MSDLWKKLNLKAQDRIVVENAPDSFEEVLSRLSGVKVLRKPISSAAFFIFFVTRRAEIDRIAGLLAELPAGDIVVWLAYPKGSSKRYSCDFSRDSGWQRLGKAGFEAVRQVAIDEDWSALRFRRVGFIKKMTRDKTRALTEKGRKVAGQG